MLESENWKWDCDVAMDEYEVLCKIFEIEEIHVQVVRNSKSGV